MSLPRCMFLNCKYNLKTYCKDESEFKKCEYQRLVQYELNTQVLELQNMLQFNRQDFKKCPFCGGIFKINA